MNGYMEKEPLTSREMVYAPVIIPTLCRDQHFIRCIESLRKNPWAKYTDLYIGLDYPAKEAHWDGYRKISAYLEQPLPEFHAVHIFRREKNVGAACNSGLLRKMVSKEYDRFLYLEDDLEVSPNFLEYMDKALMEYEDDPNVVMVTGYAYPLEWKAKEASTVVRQGFNGSAWGMGMWNSKRTTIARYLRSYGLSKDFSHAFRTGCFDKMIDRAIKDYVDLCENGWGSKRAFLNNVTDIALRIYLAVQHKYVIMPLLSKVRNHGYDGSGIYCQRIEEIAGGDFCVDNYLFSAQPIDGSATFTLIEDQSFDTNLNQEILNQFDSVSLEVMENVWCRAKRIARYGRYGGVLLLINRTIKKISRYLKGYLNVK